LSNDRLFINGVAETQGRKPQAHMSGNERTGLTEQEHPDGNASSISLIPSPSLYTPNEIVWANKEITCAVSGTETINSWSTLAARTAEHGPHESAKREWPPSRIHEHP